MAQTNTICNEPGCIAAIASLQDELRQLKSHLMGSVAENKRLHATVTAYGLKLASLEAASPIMGPATRGPPVPPEEVDGATEVAMEDEACALPAQVPCAPPAQKTQASPAWVDVGAKRKRKLSPTDKKPKKPATPAATKKDVKGPTTKQVRPNEATGAIPKAKGPVTGPIGGSPKKGGKYVPCISAYNTNVKDMTGRISDLLGHTDFSLRLVNRTVTSFQVNTLEEFEK